MKIFIRNTILALLAFVLPVNAAAQLPAAIAEADSAYNAGDYLTAIRLYDRVIKNDGISPEIYYNLGNAFYRTGKLGRAIINYHRALKLDPSFTEARENLDFVNTKILDKPEDDSSFLSNVHRGVVAKVSPDGWAWIAFAFFVLLLAAIAAYLFSNRVKVRKAGFFGGLVALVLFVYALSIAIGAAHAWEKRNTAVVIVPTTNLSTTPGNTSRDATLIPIHEGTFVEILDSISIPGATTAPLWYEVKINNSTKAWVNAADVEQI